MLIVGISNEQKQRKCLSVFFKYNRILSTTAKYAEGKMFHSGMQSHRGLIAQSQCIVAHNIFIVVVVVVLCIFVICFFVCPGHHIRMHPNFIVETVEDWLIMLFPNQPLLLSCNIYLFVTIRWASGWDLSGIEHRGYYYDNSAIEHVTIHYVRAFLCVKTNFNASRSKWNRLSSKKNQREYLALNEFIKILCSIMVF